jgi:hypothetical protein
MFMGSQDQKMATPKEWPFFFTARDQIWYLNKKDYWKHPIYIQLYPIMKIGISDSDK